MKVTQASSEGQPLPLEHEPEGEPLFQRKMRLKGLGFRHRNPAELQTLLVERAAPVTRCRGRAPGQLRQPPPA
jgi:hypothetical protein